MIEQAPPGPPARPSRRWLRNRPIRVKLAIILFLPVLSVIALTGLTVLSSADRAASADQARELVVVGGVAARLVGALQAERAAAALAFAEASSAASLAAYRQANEATDAVATQFLSGIARIRVPENLVPLLARIRTSLDGLPALREQVLSAPDAVLSAVAFRYRTAIADLISYRQALGQADVSAGTSSGLRAAAALSAAIESIGQLQVAAVRAMTAGALTPAAQQEIVASSTGFAESMQSFADLSEPAWPALLNTRMSGLGDQVLVAERLQNVVVRSQPGMAMDLDTSPAGWSAAVGARMEAMHSVEADLDTALLAAVTSERDAQMRSITTTLGVVAGLLLVAGVIGWVVASSLSRSLSRLQTGAIEVASARLPQMVKELDAESADPATVERLMAAAAEPVPIDGTDEVGQVAQAFNHVTASAVRVAGEQAALRAGVGAILVSLSRRLQLRADAMVTSLDTLEQGETDSDRLAKLFALDHIAALIRRLIFNLQVLAGGRAGRPRPQPVPLADILRAAGQEIDQYQRVVTSAVDESVHIRGEAADELVHLLAELLDNATRFSPPDSEVPVEAKRVGDLVYIQIRDEGTGMSTTDLAQARDRIANPHRLDHRTTQHMGLPVAGALAQRLGVKIEFRSVLRKGTWVDLTVPASLVDRSAVTDDGEPTELLVPVARPARPPARRPMVAPVIFEEMARSPDRSWFRTATPDGPSTPAEWQASTRAAQAAESAPITEWTQNGLPIRQPGDRVIPSIDVVIAQPAPVVRDADRLRRQMAAYQNGLGQAGRRRVEAGIAED